MIEKTGLVVLTTILPILELRGGIPLALSLGFDPASAFFLTVFFNSIIFLPIFFGLKVFYEEFFSKINFVNKTIERIRKKGSPYVKKYGFIGLTLFVAVPLPMSGVYSGTILSWLLGLEWKKAFLAVVLGASIAGLIVLGISLGVFASIPMLFK